MRKNLLGGCWRKNHVTKEPLSPPRSEHPEGSPAGLCFLLQVLMYMYIQIYKLPVHNIPPMNWPCHNL